MLASEPLVSKPEREFLRKALKDGVRLDGRRDVDQRPLRVSFAGNGVCEVQLGQTRVLCRVTCELGKPFVDRPLDGAYLFDVVLSPIASASYPRDGSTQESARICRLIERTLRESEAIDTESLCVLAGSHVWSVQVNIVVLDAAGNLADACSWAALAALMHFRRPAASVSNGVAKIYEWHEMDPSPLAVHHTPVCVSFGLLSDGETAMADPSAAEEKVLDSTVTVAMNGQGELCSVLHFGCAVEADTLLRCISVTTVRSAEIIATLNEAVKQSLAATGNIGARNLISYLEAPK